MICIYELMDKDYKIERERQILTLAESKEFIYNENLLIKVRVIRGRKIFRI